MRAVAKRLVRGGATTTQKDKLISSHNLFAHGIYKCHRTLNYIRAVEQRINDCTAPRNFGQLASAIVSLDTSVRGSWVNIAVHRPRASFGVGAA